MMTPRPPILHAFLCTTDCERSSRLRYILPLGAVTIIFSLRGPYLNLTQGASLAALGAVLASSPAFLW